MTITDAYDENALETTINIVHERTIANLEESILERISEMYYDILDELQAVFPGESEESADENRDLFVEKMTTRFISNLKEN